MTRCMASRDRRQSFLLAMPADTGGPACHPATLLKLYLHGYLDRVPSSRRPERHAQSNLRVLWPTGRLAPDCKTIAAFRRGNGQGLKATSRHFTPLCRRLDRFSDSLDGSGLSGSSQAPRSHGFGQAPGHSTTLLSWSRSRSRKQEP